MSGHIRGVAAQIQREEPSALYVHCLANCTNLCLQTVGKSILPVRDALDLVMGVSQLIRFSPKRVHLFQSMQSQKTPGAPSIKPLCPTRWTVRTSAIESILTNYNVLCDVLDEINREGRDEYAAKAGGYLNQLEKLYTYFGFKLSHLLFSATEQLSITLQGINTIHEAVQASKLALNYLEKQRIEESFEVFMIYCLKPQKILPMSQPFHGIENVVNELMMVSQSIHRFESPKDYFKQMYFEAIDLC